jgi:cytochrome P450
MNLVSDLDLPAFDYAEPDVPADRYHAQLAGIRQHGWLAKSPLAYLVLDHDAGEFFLRSRKTAFPGRQIAGFFGVSSGPLAEHIDANILNLSGDHHRRLRALVGPALTPRAADRWRPVMRGFLEGLWAQVAGGSGCDFVAAVARPYPALTIAAVLGAPRQDAGRLHAWSTWVQRQFDIRALDASREEIERAVTEVEAYVAGLLAARRAAPGDDLISALLAADPGLAPRAVDEVLRFEPVTPFTARICLEQVEFRDVIFPAGTIVAVSAERANREGEGGEDFDITAARADRVLTFGAGAHYCPGANLARAELEEALAFLAPRTPGLTLDGPPQLGGIEGIYGIDKLLVSWSGTSAMSPNHGRAPDVS